MAWRAYLESVQDNPTPSDSMYANIRFEDTPTSRTIRKSYKLMAGTSRNEFRAMVRADTALLNNMDTVRTALVVDVGAEIT